MALRQPRTRLSILLTLRVLQFVKQLRRRLQPHAKKLGSSTSLGAETCLELEAKALRSLAKGMSRVSPQNKNRLLNASGRVCKRRDRNARPKFRLLTSGHDHVAIQNSASGKVQHVLQDVDDKLSPPGNALSAIAGDHSLFLKQDPGLNLEACTLNDMIQSLVAVHEAITVLEACRSQYGDDWLIAQGQDAGLNFDELFLANYEHLLWRLRTQLIDTLARKAFETLLLGGHDKNQQRLLSWFTEFADKPRALSTFPWTIKPSLAVLWGVCWMFYEHGEQNQAPKSSIRVSQSALLQNVELPQWAAPGSTDYMNFGLELLGTQTRPAAPQAAHDGVDMRSRNTDQWVPSEDLSMHRQVFSRVSPGSANGPGLGLATTYCPPIPEGLHTINSDIDSLLPAASGNATLTVYPQQFEFNVDNIDSSWPHTNLHTSLPQRTARHLTTHPPGPALIVTGAADSQGYAAPQPFAAFEQHNIYQPTAQQPQASPPNLLTDLPFISSSYHHNMGNTAPDVSPTLNLQGPRHERTQSLNSNTNIPTPVSMADPRSPIFSPAHDRRPSTSSSTGPAHQHSRHQSEDVSSQDGDLEMRRNHAYKRAEEPPKNVDGKMMCKHQECASLVFDRKCEWSKHMDKHDRPYKCAVAGCEKLQGFTYSGGLLRHEREVHKMHGGTKKSLFCPFADCKRSSGSGFTRKENLAEHIRRVHRRTSMSVDMGHLIIPRTVSSMDGASSPTNIHLPSERPFQRIVEERTEADMRTTLKRKPSDAGLSGEGENSDLRTELKRLRRENEEKDSRLRQLEAAVMALQQGRR